MKKSSFFVIALLFSGCLFINPAQAQDYYVCDTGSDRNAGTSPNQPWETFDFAISKFNKLEAGDSVLFCRSRTFTSSYPRISNFKCNAANPCTIGSYGDGPLPVIRGNASGALNFVDGGNADHDEGYVIKNLSIKGNGTGFGIFLFNDVDYVTIDNVIIEGFDIGVYSAGANPPNAGANKINEHIILKNSRIINNPGQGWLGGGNDVIIDNNKFINNGFGRKVFNHNVYASNSEDLIISNNELYQSTIVDGKCQGTSLVIHGIVKNLTIKNNNVHEDVGAAAQTCWGISVDPGYATEESFNNVTIAGNKVSNVGNVGIGCASCTNTWIVDNKITHAQDFGFTAISVPVRAEDSVKSDRVLIGGNDIELIDQNNRGKRTVKAPATDAFYLIGNTEK